MIKITSRIGYVQTIKDADFAEHVERVFGPLAYATSSGQIRRADSRKILARWEFTM